MRGQDYTDIVYETAEGIAKITINRPEVRNAFRPTTLFELSHAFNVARDDPDIGVIILTGAGTQAFCSGGDQKIRGDDGYLDSHGVGPAQRARPAGADPAHAQAGDRHGGRLRDRRRSRPARVLRPDDRRG